jgi:N-terminal C2 in EEIG1 and EHBP1 proteins
LNFAEPAKRRPSTTAMKRSGSKLIAKAGSVKNIAKAGFRFSFELAIESVDNMLGSADVVCTWERGPKLLSTPPRPVDKAKRVATFAGHPPLRQEVTIFKKKRTDATYEPKVFRLAVRTGSETGKVVGKIDLDFAEYTTLPSFSKRIAAPLSSGARLILRVSSTYNGEAESRRRKRKEGGDETSSVMSDSTLGGANDYSVAAAEEMEERNRDELDLDDLILTDDPPPAPSRPRQSPNAPLSSASSGARSRDQSRDRDQQNYAAPEPFKKKPSASTRRQPQSPNPSSRTQQPLRSQPSRDGGGRSDYQNPLLDSAVGYTPAMQTAPAPRDAFASHTAHAPQPDYDNASRSEVEKLRAANKQLRRMNDQLKEKLAEAEAMSASRGGPSAFDLESENKDLRRDVEDLEHRLAREPVYSDVVRELRESKMALAILTMERDELHQAMRTSGKGNGIDGRNML